MPERTKARRILDGLLGEPLERDIQKDVIEAFELHGWYVTHIPAGGADHHHRRQMHRAGYKPGFPDLFAAKAGRVVLVELKRPSGSTSPNQKATQQVLREQGIEVVTIRSKDEAYDWLEQHDRD